MIRSTVLTLASQQHAAAAVPHLPLFLVCSGPREVVPKVETREHAILKRRLGSGLNVATAKRQDLAYGDVWTWTAIDADTNLIPSWFEGGRDSEYAMAFMDDLASRLANRVQLTSDG